MILITNNFCIKEVTYICILQFDTLVDDEEYNVEEYDDEPDIDHSWYGQPMDDFRGKFPKVTLSNGTNRQAPIHEEKNISHREISTKALTRASRHPREKDIWEDDNYLESFENHGFEDERTHHPPTTYHKREQRVR